MDDGTRLSSIATAIEQRLDTEVHDDLCACSEWPAGCSTYGSLRPWSHTDIEKVVRYAAELLLAGDDTKAQAMTADTPTRTGQTP